MLTFQSSLSIEQLIDVVNHDALYVAKFTADRVKSGSVGLLLAMIESGTSRLGEVSFEFNERVRPAGCVNTVTVGCQEIARHVLQVLKGSSRREAAIAQRKTTNSALNNVVEHERWRRVDGTTRRRRGLCGRQASAHLLGLRLEICHVDAAILIVIVEHACREWQTVSHAGDESQ